MTEKLMLYGTGNEGAFNHYTFEKTKKVQIILREVFKNFLEIDWPLQREFENEKGEFEVIEINVEKNKDFHEIIGRNKSLGNPRIDIFYGDKKMFVAIHCPLEKRKEINKILKEKFKMPVDSSKKGELIKISENDKKKGQ